MKLIEWINGKTKLNKTTFDEFQNNINSEKVEKAGDTLTGALSIENKTQFLGIEKTRTINSKDYNIKVGIGVNGTAIIELHDLSKSSSQTQIGKLEIMTDGKVKNGQTNKYFVEESLITSAATPASNFKTISLNSIVTRNGVTQVSFRGQVGDTAIANNTRILSGLPVPVKGMTGIIGISDSQYLLGTPTWAYLSDGTIKDGYIAANKWVHIDWTYISQ